MTAPTNVGSYDFQWQMVRGGVALFGAPTVNLPIAVQLRGNEARFVFQSVPTEMLPGLAYPVTVRMSNTGTNVWRRITNYSLASQNPLSNTNWGFTRIILPGDVNPGEEAVFQFNVTPPAVPGTYDFQTQLTQDGVELFGERTPNVSVAVQPRGNAARFVAQTVPGSVLAGLTYPVTIRMLNVGTNAWTPAGGYKLASQNPLSNTNWASSRVAVVGTVLPGRRECSSSTLRRPWLPAAIIFNGRWCRRGRVVWRADSQCVGAGQSSR